ncbi:MAG TPA: Rab family GTPase [Anaerolineae bacterium]|nr:Rab family GTPase [Anaerolineae bacterium]
MEIPATPRGPQETKSIPIVKVVVAGDGSVGKTSLIRRYSEGMFIASRVMTIGVDFQTASVEVSGQKIKLSIWDIAGQDRFGSFRGSFYRGARAVALVYDVTDRLSWDNLPRWQAEIAKVAPAARYVVVGNKIDLDRSIPREEAEQFASNQGFPYIETSALTEAGVKEFFNTLGRLATIR